MIANFFVKYTRCLSYYDEVEKSSPLLGEYTKAFEYTYHSINP